MIATLCFLFLACGGGGGSNTSGAAPTLTTQPLSQTVTAPGNATFTVAATGSPSLSYQWNLGGTAIPNATSASYTTPATPAGSYSYTCTVTNAFGSTISNQAILRVTAITPVGPPSADQVGPRVALTSATGGTLAAGNYSGKTYTSAVSCAATGVYNFTDCEFQVGFGVVFGGNSITRTVTLDHCRIATNGIYFEDGGQKNWVIKWCDVRGNGQALRPKGLTIYDNVTPTPFVVEDSIVSISELGSPVAHVEAMQCLGGNLMTFSRVRFITLEPYKDSVTGQTASINNTSGNTLFEDCEFLEENAFYYTVYSNGADVVFQNCRLVKGIAGYVYPSSAVKATFEGCTDIVSGLPIP